MVISKENQAGCLDFKEAKQLVEKFFAENDYSGKRLLLIVPDNTRSGPVGEIFQMIFDSIADKAAALDILIALGTHQPMSDAEICKRLAITAEQRKTRYASVNFFNHQWHKPETFTSIGIITAGEISQISDGQFSEDVDVSINKLIFDYDEFFILGPVFPHEVVGFWPFEQAGWRVVGGRLRPER